MKPIARLKEQARQHEQREEWEQAIQLYLQVLRAGEEREGEAELGIYNRVGDLYLRLGRQAEAVQYYEQAADRYAEAGFYNNAIALCSKALRYMPGRSELYLRLGKFSAAQGFMVDARRWFLEYAEHMLRAGEEAKAFEALHELADASGDPEVRELLAGQLLEHGRGSEAVVELKRAYAERVNAGQRAEADALRAQIQSLEPGGSLDESGDGWAPGEAARTGTVQADGGDALPLMSAAGAAGLGEVPLDVTLEEAAPPLPLLDIDGGPGGAEPLPLLDVGGGPGGADRDLDTLIGFEPTIQASEPPLEIGLGEGVGAIEVDEGAVEEGDGTAVPGEDVPEEDAERAIARAGELAVMGRTAEAVEELDAAQRRLADAGRLEEALRVVDEVVRLDPDRVQAHQDRVEYAFRLDRSDRLVSDYLDLAASLRRAGASERATAIYRRVLDLDPRNPQALEALGEGPREAGVGVGGGDELVDLGDLLRAEEEPLTDTTRFLVPEEEPTGDEQQDFAEMLEQFKAKLAEHVPPDDLASHYDLGLAFKEMGLLDEAIAQFQKALRTGRVPLKVYEELGHCFVLKEQYNVAIKVFSRALQAPHEDESELVGIFYHLGRCYEELGQAVQARDAYERVFGVDINFRDVAERLARL